MAYLAPGGAHLRLAWKGTLSLVTRLEDSAPVNFVRPSADVLFKSAAECVGENLMAIVLTGMGVDGTAGTMAVKAQGGKVIAQDERSSVAYCMPKSVIESGFADSVLSLDKIAAEIVKFMEE